ncbi:hypothetical protein FKG94_20920 [Exilibacterium tricleocarpae]|uniref:Uncharacterized protein n=1 Tax=Exilibacterium tricleocarpae TaxID=2591008 RepID=A0A545T0R5_9GAMM|nr:hypothetical protein [Exilibacterium tricleocarpae]TQV70790.1 hypothetical protein FKG94_20920 [Exilibacterium tricleocarpae]
MAKIVIGGTLSEATGGKFANGAVTAAFAAVVQSALSDDGEAPLYTDENGEEYFLDSDGNRAYTAGYFDENGNPILAMEWPSLPQGAVDFAAGFGDGISFGLTGYIRNSLNVDGSVNYNSGYYFSGELSSLPVLGGAGFKGGKYLVGPRGPLFGNRYLRNGKTGFFNKGYRRLGWSRYGGKGKSAYHFEYRVGNHGSKRPWSVVPSKDVKKWQVIYIIAFENY